MSHFLGMTKLLVATGYKAVGVGFLFSVEIVNLDESTPDLICENLPDYPSGIDGVSGQLYNKKHPIICGGHAFFYLCKCHIFKDGVWQSIQSLNECRAYSASAVFPNRNNNDEDDILLIAGGYDGSKVLSTVESFDGNVWNQTMFADLHTKIGLHCMVKINKTMLLLISGTVDNTYAGITEDTYFFDIIQNMWTSGPKLNIGRRYHSCAVMNWMNPKTGTPEKVRY